ncbi:MAG TPA: YggS family pyridoxal phosphate-dependent enzyme [Terriglobales bacterium]|nr:YggS family pyridoxal phosphate-dependent enzyme [Terriglobales bacterium]
MGIADNIARVRERIGAAAVHAGREPPEITLMAVSKTFPPDEIAEAHAAGLRVFGENRVQEFAGKIAGLRGLAGAEWHLIGHLQSNKAGKAAELFDAIDTVDSLSLAERLNQAAGKLGKKLRALIEVNVGGEAAKSGVALNSAELEAILSAAPRLGNLEILGLMTIPPLSEDPQGARPYFRRLRELRDAIAARKLPGVSMEVLSMGMSHDFAVAIDEGSTCVRVGTAIFGERHKAQPQGTLRGSGD